MNPPMFAIEKFKTVPFHFNFYKIIRSRVKKRNKLHRVSNFILSISITYHPHCSLLRKVKAGRKGRNDLQNQPGNIIIVAVILRSMLRDFIWKFRSSYSSLCSILNSPSYPALVSNSNTLIKICTAPHCSHRELPQYPSSARKYTFPISLLVLDR